MAATEKERLGPALLLLALAALFSGAYLYLNSLVTNRGLQCLALPLGGLLAAALYRAIQVHVLRARRRGLLFALAAVWLAALLALGLGLHHLRQKKVFRDQINALLMKREWNVLLKTLSPAAAADDDFLSYALARASQETGSLAQAEAAYRRCLELNDRHLYALGWLARLHFTTGRPKEAAAIYARLLKLEPGLPEERYLYALALERAGQARAAVDEFRILLNRADLPRESREELERRVHALTGGGGGTD